MDGKLDGILLAGSHNEDVLFREVLNDLVVESQHESLERLMVLQAKDMSDGVWYGAREAAVVARRGMWHGFDACLPSGWCTVASYHDKL